MKIIRFKKFITENTSQLTKMTHLEHIEDYIFNEGTAGINQAINFLENIYDVMKGKANTKIITQSKWDGSPSIVAGVNPENKKFFVATKSAFSKNPKLLYTNSNIDDEYGDKGDLADKLKDCLKYLPNVLNDRIIQGDLLFSVSNKKKETIDNKKYITFRANTLTFAVPEDSELAYKIDKAKLGIVFHAFYDGDTIQNMKVNFEISKSSFKEHSDVWFDTSTYEDLSGNVFFTEKESEEYLDLISKIKNTKVDTKLLDFLVNNQVLVKSYTNKLYTAGSSFSNTKILVSGLISYIEGKLKQEIDKVKTEKTKEIKTKKMNDIIDFLKSNDKEMINIYNLFNLFTKTKNMVIEKLEEIRNTKFFIQTNDGYKVTKSEGFVVADRLSNYVVKLVDRAEFSKNNFNMSLNRKNESFSKFMSMLNEALDLSKFNLKVGSKKVNIFIGRLQPPHKVHMKRLDQGNITELFLVKGAKTSESKSPFPFEIQRDMIKSVYKDTINVTQISGAFIGDIINILRKDDKEVDIIYCGEDRKKAYEDQINRYSKDLNLNVKVVAFDRSNADSTSGTDVRNSLKKDNEEGFEEFKTYMNKELATKKWYDKLKGYIYI